ncbi:uncharacterized protein LTR77_009580 [Saxophila tyrrhenica]|uniref:Uncharacterized protein n=1 Tax=Saxophila tyrrhenica TaxID=1690608 RepID=A0AAV9NY13_9PEZI|nr:hypothetical protein LTR77_009580 [Saxophila tyrrhenica]
MYDLQQPSINFFNASLSLHRLIGKAISQLYDQNLGYDDLLSEPESIPRIIGMDQEMDNWRSALTSELAVVWSHDLPASGSYHDRTLGRFRVMLTLRFHNLSILVHRPLLCKALDQLSKSTGDAVISMVSEMTNRSISICLRSAEETIDIVHGVVIDPDRSWPMLGAWWFTVYYLFNAALVVFSNALIQRALPSRQDASPAQNLDHLNRAIAAFRLLDRNNRVVERCTEYIEYLALVMERQLAVKPWLQQQQQQQQSAAGEVGQAVDALGGDVYAGLPDLNDFLKDEMELAQFFASGIFDVQNSYDGLVGGFQ